MLSLASLVYFEQLSTDTMDGMGRERLGRLVAEQRRTKGLSVSAAARAAGINRATWDHIERGTRQTETYNYGPVERVLGWQAGSIDAIMAGGEPALASQGTNGTTGAAFEDDDADDLALEIQMIEASDLPMSAKRAMIREVERLRDRQRREREAFAERQAAERKEQIETWLRFASGPTATT